MKTWPELLKIEIERTRSMLMPEASFAAAVDSIVEQPSSAIEGVHFTFERAEPFRTVSVGPVGLGTETASFLIEGLGDPVGTQCRVRVWRKRPTSLSGDALDIGTLNGLLQDWAQAFWKGSIRDGRTGLPLFMKAGVQALVDRTLQTLTTDSGAAYGFFADLDNFKPVNDTRGMSEGDRVIQECGVILDRVVPREALTLRRTEGGDEFIVFLPTSVPVNALSTAESIMRAVRVHDFNVGEIRIDVAVGIDTAARSDENFASKTLEDRAGKAVKPEGGSKLRGLARFTPTPGGQPIANFDRLTRDLALCVIKTGAADEKRLNNPWLELIADKAQHVLGGSLSNAQNISAGVQPLIDWMQPEWLDAVTRIGSPFTGNIDRSTAFSRFDAAMAVAQGVFRSSLRAPADELKDRSLELHYEPVLRACALFLLPQQLPIFTCGDDLAGAHRMDLGGFYRVPDDHTAEIPPRRPILIKIGYAPLRVPESLFAATIVVDDRPSASGGLPDFWAATIASLISAVEADPNIPAVYVLGDQRYGVETIARLKMIHERTLPSERVAEKTGLSIRVIESAMDRLAGKIFVMDDEAAIVHHLAEQLLPACELEPGTHKNRSDAPIFQRRMEMEPLSLGPTDGCRVHTIKEAFPIVLEIARHSTDAVIRDQAGRGLRELLDFKVHLRYPEQDMIPTFYQDDRQSMENYFRQQFLEEEGLFGKWFRHDAQEDVVVDHVVDVIQNLDQQFATRRAVLVVPHIIQPMQSPTPLGLISIRIVPRFLGDRVALTYSFTWRTVEALVGFPYSIYGSVRFAQHLTNRIREKLPLELRGRVATVDVSYIAHSLHIFVDDYGQTIARKIVNDASY